MNSGTTSEGSNTSYPSTLDMKGSDALLVATFLRLKREGFRPSRDLILALTSDEEDGPAASVGEPNPSSDRIAPKRRESGI